MNDEDKLFEKNALLAIWLKLKDVDKKLNNLLEDLDGEEENIDEDGLYE